MTLIKYNQKRKFQETPEPSGKKAKGHKKLRFCIQKHDASHLHYDFRLELEGVLKSWAVPKGPSLDPSVKRLAMMVEDHPYDYRDFEGIIPAGNYGAGTVIVWDEGYYYPLEETNDPEKILKKGLYSGNLKFRLEGKKVNGEFVLVKLKGKEDNSWLLIKHKDEYASTDDITLNDRSVKTGRTLEDISEPKKERKETAKKEKVAVNLPKKSKMPDKVKPMLATLVKDVFDHPDWIYELKYDGYRAIAEVRNNKVEIYSRNLLPFNDRFPSVVKALKKLELEVLLDGEIVAVDKNGVSKFQYLQNYNEKVHSLIFYVFDILFLNGYDTTKLTLIERKELLRDALPEVKGIKFSDYIIEKGTELFKKMEEVGQEGIIAKNTKSLYLIGKRSNDWLKIKTSKRQEAIICGFTAPKGSRKEFGSLVLGVYKNNKLEYIGSSGGGFTEENLKSLKKKFDPLITDENPFGKKIKAASKITWVKPRLICEVNFSEWTDEGLMRHPVFLGLRIDKKPEEVIEEKEKSIEIPAKKSAKETDLKIEEKVKSSARKSEKKESSEPELSIKESSAASKSKAKNETVKINGKELTLTNLQKIYWPEEGYTKGDLIEYYIKMADYILPYLKDRPESLNRHPNGINSGNFFQKNMPDTLPDWIQTKLVRSDSTTVNYMLCQNKAALIYMANLGCIEINPWSSRLKNLDNPDFSVIDLDPEDISFEKVIETARVVKDVLDEYDLPGFCKTSGATGLHIYIPLGGKYDYEQSKNFAHIIASLVHERLPDITSLERSPKNRQKRIYLDYLQNNKGQTLAAPYSVRPKPGATVSAPLKWEEVKSGLSPSQFTIFNMPDRVEKLGDLFSDVLKKGINLGQFLDKLKG